MRLLLTGASGQLGAYLIRELQAAGLEFTAWSGAAADQRCGVKLRPVDLGDEGATSAAFTDAAPTVVLHAAAVSRVADCLRDPARAQAINAGGAAILAALCARQSARLVYVSTDLVFDGEKGNYGESDAPAPVSEYGRSKAAGELATRAAPDHAVVRVSLLYGPARNGRTSFFEDQISALRAGRPIPLFHDEWRSPLDLATAARALLAVAVSDYQGTLHVSGPERMSRLEMGRRLANFFELDPSPLVAVPRAQAPAPEPRPRDLSFNPSRWRGCFPQLAWPSFEQALAEMTADA